MNHTTECFDAVARVASRQEVGCSCKHRLTHCSFTHINGWKVPCWACCAVFVTHQNDSSVLIGWSAVDGKFGGGGSSKLSVGGGQEAAPCIMAETSLATERLWASWLYLHR